MHIVGYNRTVNAWLSCETDSIPLSRSIYRNIYLTYGERGKEREHNFLFAKKERFVDRWI